MKRILFLFALLLFFTGCSIKNIDDNQIDDVIDEALKSEINGTNVIFEGYKYYLPRGMQIVDKKEYNSIILSNGSHYYLYVDVVSYYHKNSVDFSINKGLYFSKKMSYNGKEGYIEIDSKDDDTYLLKVVYNYAKIEVCVSLEEIEDSIYNSIIILSSITYNDTILNSLVGDATLDYQEEEYDLFDSKREDGTFLDYIEEYDVYNENSNLKDEDILDS